MDMEQPIEELAADQPVKPVKPKRHPDHDGEAWHAQARGRWRRAEELVPEAPLEVYDAPALPAWSAPGHVKRELFGRYIVERDTGIAHDVQHALAECGLDAIRNATFYHFEVELPGDVIDCACMEA